MDIEALTSAAGVGALAAAMRLDRLDPLAAATAMRADGHAPDLAAAALTQASLRRRGVAKFGSDAERMFFTRAGLEQATRAAVAQRRAARLAASGVRQVADLGCGIGADSIAFARAGLRVLAVESDRGTADVARANVDALGLRPLIEVIDADATTIDLAGVEAAFCDPARREGGQRRFDPRAFTPPWSFVEHLHRTITATVVKLAPGLDHALIPAGAEAEWVSVDGDLVEAVLWCGPLAEVPRRATLLRGVAHELVGTGERSAPVGEVGRYLYAPDGAVLRAHLVAELAERLGGRLADPHIAYVFTDAPAANPYARGFEVLEPLPFGLKPLRAALRVRGIGRLEILKRGVAVEPDRLRRDLRLDGPDEASLVLLRRGGTPVALLCRPLPGLTA